MLNASFRVGGSHFLTGLYRFSDYPSRLMPPMLVFHVANTIFHRPDTTFRASTPILRPSNTENEEWRIIYDA